MPGVAAGLFGLDEGGIMAILAEYNPGAPGLRPALVGAGPAAQGGGRVAEGDVPTKHP